MQKTKKNPWIELLVNIFLPSFILSKFSDQWGALNTLLIALAFPAIYFIWELAKEKKVNYLSLFGLLNTLFRGLLAVFELGGAWFVVNEAIFPLILFVFVFASAYSTKPFIKWMLSQSGAIDFDKLEAQAHSNDHGENFIHLQKKTTIMFSMTLLFSAVVNLLIALVVFKDIPETLAKDERAKILNEQISQMTIWGWVGITIPSLLALGFIFYHYFKKMGVYTNTTLEELIKK